MNNFGRIFRFSVFGESHGKGIGICIDGCPPGIEVNKEEFLRDLQKRLPEGKAVTKRKEKDLPEIISGIYDNHTTGMPIVINLLNQDCDSSTYDSYKDVPRPGHVDFAVKSKYGEYCDLRGSGHFSGRLTAALVLAGTLAKKLIAPMQIVAKVLEVKGNKDFDAIIDEAIRRGDSLGALIDCYVENVPIGLGEPFFDSVESQLSHALFSIPGIKGIEFGKGFQASLMWGSEYNDCFINEKGKTSSNNAGGVNGGISNGNKIELKLAVRPPASIKIKQRTFNFTSKEETYLSAHGRHDVCFALRLPVVVEALVACVLADFLCLQKAAKS